MDLVIGAVACLFVLLLIVIVLTPQRTFLHNGIIIGLGAVSTGLGLYYASKN